MNVNADFNQRVVLQTGALPWVASPMAGVERRMLDRIGDEVARATSIVRYAPNSAFSAHTHGGGEEFLVLEGVFADEHGAYPAGTYVRNPPGTAHTPRVGPEGCTIFVKLWQMQTRGETAVTLDTAADHPAWQPGANAGVSVLPLYRHGEETVRMVRFEPGAVVTPHAHPGGEELLVLEGGFRDEEGHYGAGTWVRSPVGTRHAPVSDEGCLLWIKTGHLAGEIRAPVA